MHIFSKPLKEEKKKKKAVMVYRSPVILNYNKQQVNEV